MSKLALFVFVFLVPHVGLAAQASPSNQNTVPNWMAWNMFQQSLAFHSQRSPEEVKKMLAAQFALTRDESAMLLQAGRAFVETLNRIDDDSKTEAQRRYPDLMRRATGAKVKLTRRDGAPWKTLRDRIMEDGLYAEIQRQKEAALVGHLDTLKRNLDTWKFTEIGKWVQTTVAPNIKVFTQQAPVPGTPASGQRVFVPSTSIGK